MDVIGRAAMGQRESQQFQHPFTRLCSDVLLAEGDNLVEWASWLVPWSIFKI
jgi:hypothetical protein